MSLNKIITILLAALLLNLAIPLPLQGAYVIRNGKLVSKKYMVEFSLEEHFALGVEAMEVEDWKEGERQFRTVINNFSTHVRAQEALFYAGVCGAKNREYGSANKSLSRYLKFPKSSEHAEEALQTKFEIAEAFRQGAKTRLFGAESMPKWLPAKEQALEIYEEIITSLPTSDLAARALFSKSLLLYKTKEYQETVENLSILIQRFPNHPLVAESYLNLVRAIRQEGRSEQQNSDLLALAALKVKRFRQNFPREERVALAEQELRAMQEDYVAGLYEVARFYRRVKAPGSAIIYYASIVNQFPDTSLAQKCREHLEELSDYVETAQIKVNTV